MTKVHVEYDYEIGKLANQDIESVEALFKANTQRSNVKVTEIKEEEAMGKDRNFKVEVEVMSSYDGYAGGPGELSQDVMLALSSGASLESYRTRVVKVEATEVKPPTTVELKRRGQTPAQICQDRGWGPGTRLQGKWDGVDKHPRRAVITAIGEVKVFGDYIGDGSEHQNERQIPFDHIEWEEA